MKNKKQIRADFRDSVFSRDRYSCAYCGKKHDRNDAEETLDAHHVTPREDMPNGGYVKENGVSLCKDGCHFEAEMWLKNGQGKEGLDPESLYKAIGSSHEEAVASSEQLKPERKQTMKQGDNT